MKKVDRVVKSLVTLTVIVWRCKLIKLAEKVTKINDIRCTYLYVHVVHIWLHEVCMCGPLAPHNNMCGIEGNA